ncbi:MAG: hypothetical protein WC836_09960 [Desulfobacula sp.]|jgi:hypothetical protein
MTERKRIYLLMVIMTVSSLIIAGITIAVLYHTAFEAQKARQGNDHPFDVSRIGNKDR